MGYFGTDGIRGEAGSFLTPDLAQRVGQAAATVLAQPGDRFILGEDPRVSSDMLAAAFAAGVMAAGCAVEPLGQVPTPGVAYVTKHHGAVAGAMISASHNPVGDNGIKLFAGDGTKLREPQEAAIEAILDDPSKRRTSIGVQTGRFRRETRGAEHYREFLEQVLPAGLRGLRVVIDSGFGAASTYAPSIFEHLGANVAAINCTPDGQRINVACGSEHPQDVQRIVQGIGAQVGIAYDGDADRAILVDELGQTVDGDQILCMMALDHLDRVPLPGGEVVGTILSNQGLAVALEAKGITLHRADVGDKYIAWRMLESGAIFGGEQSGHLIFGAHAWTGDGILTSLLVADLVRRTGRPLSELAAQMSRFPQVAINIKSTNKECWTTDTALLDQMKAWNGAIYGADRGRIVLRNSGTEPKVRIMVESEHEDVARDYASRAEQLLLRCLAEDRVPA